MWRFGFRTHIGLATRICIEIGLHRRVSPHFRPRLCAEMKRRIFWSSYCLDRQVSIILGRPFVRSDRDIDAEVSAVICSFINSDPHALKLPWDIDESTTEESSTPTQLMPETPRLAVPCPDLSTRSDSDALNPRSNKVSIAWVRSQPYQTV